ncbi:transposable element Tcb2 transposase [Trichonephila clavipes]|nr:transposable element Tcb2 transposase [Trichonephila clavipes]
MSSRHHIDDFMRGRIIGKIEGRKITDVAREFDIAHSVVSRLWKSFKTTGMCSRRHGGGRVRSTTPAEDRYIVLSAKRNRRTTAQQVANQFLAASGKQISPKTVARRLRGGGLYARRPVVCVPLTRQHRTARLQWCREHHNWTEPDWEKDRYPTCSIMVWAGIMINGRMRLHVVANGTMTGQRYIDEVLLPHVRLFRGAVGDKFVFMDDNATCHRTLAVQDCLDSEDALGRQVAGRNYPPTIKNTLIRALTEEWDKLPQQLLDNVVQSMLPLLHWKREGGYCHGDPTSFAALLENFYTNCSKKLALRVFAIDCHYTSIDICIKLTSCNQKSCYFLLFRSGLILIWHKPRKLLQRLARPISCFLHASRIQPTVVPIYFSDMGWRLASRAICPENVTVVIWHNVNFLYH